MAEARSTHEVRPVTNARTLRTAAAAGVTDLRTDGPGRYFTGSGKAGCLITKQGGRWRIFSPISNGYLVETLGTALTVAARLIGEQVEILDRSEALTDAELDTVADDTAHPEYYFRQCCIAERLNRQAALAKASV